MHAATLRDVLAGTTRAWLSAAADAASALRRDAEMRSGYKKVRMKLGRGERRPGGAGHFHSPRDDIFVQSPA